MLGVFKIYAAGVVWVLSLVATPGAVELRDPSVGMYGTVEEVVLPGSELEAVPLDDSSPVVLRITSVYPHGDAMRYSFSFYGLEPGQYNLVDYLRRKDGGALGGLPPLPVEVRALLGPGQLLPAALPGADLPAMGGYRGLLVVLGVLWGVVLLGMVLALRKKKVEAQLPEPPPTVADRLRPLVLKARSGDLSKDGQAQLERALLIFWRERLGLGDVPASEAASKLRDHQEAGVLLRQLEEWLHRPGSGGGEDLTRLLAPYEKITAENLSLPQL